MGFNNAKILRDAQKKAEAEIRRMVVEMGNTALNWYQKSWYLQGFQGEGFEPWPKRKRRDAGRAILVKTGRLKRSLRKVGEGAYSVSIFTNVPYARIHNEGGAINKKASTSILSFNKAGKFTRQRTQRQRDRTSYQHKASIGAHSIQMPKRQFVGYSGRLNRELIRLFDNRIKSIFK